LGINAIWKKVHTIDDRKRPIFTILRYNLVYKPFEILKQLQIKNVEMTEVHKTCKELLIARGYTVEEEDAERILGVKNGEHICVFIVESPINVKTVETLISLMNTENLNKGIVVYYHKITPYAKNVIEASEDVTLELFSERELRFNITNHSYVPKHELVLQTDKCAVQLASISSKLPRLLQTDPVVRFYGFQPKDIIRITRKDNSVAYRTVISC
jgi:DNA-directed RNA polymerase subunit H (RpoH/RPB5)